MNLKYLKISKSNCDNDTGRILSKKPVYTAMSNGSWIAGGFARAVAHSIFNINNMTVKKYLVPNKYRGGEDREPCGDVDIFSPAHVEIDKIIHKMKTLKSYGGFATNFENVWFEDSDRSCPFSKYTIQLVDDQKYRYNTIEDCLSSFDIRNARYGIVLKENSYYLVYDDASLILDKNKTLDIVHAFGPFLAVRVLKYIIYKNCKNGMTPESHEKLTEWFIRAASGVWDEHFNERHLSSIANNIKNMQHYGYMKPEDLILFLGKWRYQYRKEKYGPSFDVDWAAHQIEKI